jgi:CRISPR-associated protein Cmr4
LLFLYCVSPLHMGAGSALGAIDNPIQRERHTLHPMIVGSGIKGALRHWCKTQADQIEATEGDQTAGSGSRRNSKSHAEVEAVFGPEPSASSEHAGALSVSDAQIVCFPVRSARETFVYATCPTALARLQRMARLGGLVREPGFVACSVPSLEREDQAIVLDKALVSRDELILEAFRCEPTERGKAELSGFATVLAASVFGQESSYFARKLASHLVLLHDDRFNHFVQHATSVEPHVRIEDVSGTADDGGLFYTENLPPETVMVSLLMASRSRRKSEGQGGAEPRMSAEDVLAFVAGRLRPGLIQLGGDATIGRGLVVARSVGLETAE